ncbi:ATPase [Rhizoctonia solani]|nr:ATPase [Rhizoctonia solani]
MVAASRDVRKIAVDVAMFAVSNIALYYAFKYVMSSLDPQQEKRKAAKAKSAKVLDRLGVKELELTEYEEIIAAEVIHPNDITTGFEDIGGLDPIISSLRESVIYPLCYPELFASNGGLLGAPKGVLLYGPPGCGKTMLAKALAKESSATFINIAVSVLTNKWYGESNKLVAGLFGLARKMQPAIIFIDEIDSFLGERGRGDHEVTGMMKAEFMTCVFTTSFYFLADVLRAVFRLWDGLASGENTRILVLGATNRPNDIDQAILRRMPKRFAVRLPDLEQRTKILNLMLKDSALAPNFSIRELARRTEGLSGSDLKEACRNAAMVPVREYMRQNGGSVEDMRRAQAEGFKLRPLAMTDFFAADGTTQPVVNAPYGIGANQESLD